MNPILIPLLQLGSNLIERWIPDKAAQAKAEMDLLKMAGEQDFQSTIKQIEVNIQEAQHQSIFVAGWRPFVGWICGLGLAYQAILHNLIEWLSGIYGFPVPPAPDSDVLIYVLGGLLGLGALRTYEKRSKLSK
jgi:hypothetical protein